MESVSQPSQGMELAEELRAYILRSVHRAEGDTTAQKPGHRIKFQWPPHPESYSHHVLPSDWTGKSEITIGGETFKVEMARVGNLLFGRIPELWFESKGRSEEELLRNMASGAQPLLGRQRLIAETLERPGRFTGSINTLPNLDLLKLFYCPDRDVANDGRREVETQASSRVFLPSLILILEDHTHPFRRSAQWSVLDLFEDLGSFCQTEEESLEVLKAMQTLIWSAEDDYARTVYKAGVVMGGQLPYDLGGNALLECLQAPSKIGRRSAIHGCFHLAEWAPENRPIIIDALRKASVNDPELILRHYALAISEDIIRADNTHAEDIHFEGEGQ